MVAVAAMAVVPGLATTTPARADSLPDKDSNSDFSSYQLGYDDGRLHVFTGDSVYQTDLTDPADPTYSRVVAGVQNAVDPNTSFEGGFNVSDSGTALVTMGFPGGVGHIDLDTGTVTAVGDLDGDGQPDNAGAVAARGDGTFYTLLANGASSNELYRISPDGGGGFTTGKAITVDTGNATGSLAFAPDGSLVVDSFDFTNQQGQFFRISAQELADFESDGTTPALTSLGAVDLNGASNLTVDHAGNVYVASSTAVGRLDFDTDTVETLFGDFAANPFGVPFSELPVNGLTYDAAGNALAFAAYDSDSQEYVLQTLAVPEPASLALLGLGLGMGLTVTRRRPGQS